MSIRMRELMQLKNEFTAIVIPTQDSDVFGLLSLGGSCLEFDI